MGKVYRPIRDPNHRNYLSYSAYPKDELPPLALGNFYILSADLATFIGNNMSLQSVGTLEDLSVAMWLRDIEVQRSLQIILIYNHSFKKIYLRRCSQCIGSGFAR